MKIEKKNYKEDFDFSPDFLFNGEVCVPPVDWDLVIWSGLARSSDAAEVTYTASHRGDRYINCVLDGDRIRIIMDNHGLPMGQLKYEYYAYVPSVDYPDGTRQLVKSGKFDISLVGVGCGADIADGEVEISVPIAILTAYDLAVRHGYTGTRDEYIELIRQLPDAVSDARDAISKAETDFDAVTDAVNSNEALRCISEADRQAAESDRTSAEQLREAAEMLRQTAEEERVMAEEERAEAAALRCVQFDFGEASTMAKDFNHSGCDIEVVSLMSDNIASITVMAKDGLRQFAVADFAPFVIAKGALSVWEITRQADGEAAALSVKYRLLDADA